jgi:hypothetical protein
MQLTLMGTGCWKPLEQRHLTVLLLLLLLQVHCNGAHLE